MLSLQTTEQKRTETPCFRVEHQADGSYRLHVRGKLPIDWIANLASGLSRNGLGISRGKVFKEGAMGWHGHIILESTPFSAGPERLDYPGLVRMEAPRSGSPIAIRNFELRPTEDKGGALYLEIRGEDQFGFLGAFLGRLSFYSLFPVHMEIETVGTRIHDRFWLSGVGGGRPTDAVVAALGRALEKMTKTD